MTKQEFSEWYHSKAEWLSTKARYLLSTTSIDFGEKEELIQATMEVLLINLNNLYMEGMDSYCFITMRNILYSRFVFHRKRVCCESDFSELYTYSPYDEEKDKEQDSKLSIIENRVVDKNDQEVLDALLEGKKLSKTGLSEYQIYKSTLRLKGLKIKSRKQKYRPTGNPIGRPRVIKVKLAAVKSYKGVARLLAGKIDKTYPSVKEAESEGFERTSISKCCNGKILSHKGFQWKFTKDM